MIDPRRSAPVRRPSRGNGILSLALCVALGSIGGALPARAANFTLEGGARNPAWSGYWWPMLALRGYHLYDTSGYFTPLLDYGQATGNNGPLQWEQKYKRTTDPATNWWGHCNGWAAATVMEPEPTKGVQAGSVLFNIGDIKGLLSCMHQGDPVDLFKGKPHWAGADYLTDLRARDVHRAVLYYMRDRKESLIFNISIKPEVWNYPAYRFRMTGTTDFRDPSVTQITLTFTFADDDVLPHFVGTDAFLRSYTYWVQGDWSSISNVGAADWTGDSVRNHPQFVWHPAFARPHDPGLSEPPSGLDVDWVRRLNSLAATSSQ